jgi:hypothetical protein
MRRGEASEISNLRFEILTTLATLGERVERNRRFLQPGRAGPTPAEGEPPSRKRYRLRPAGG